MAGAFGVGEAGEAPFPTDPRMGGGRIGVGGRLGLQRLLPQLLQVRLAGRGQQVCLGAGVVLGRPGDHGALLG